MMMNRTTYWACYASPQVKIPIVQFSLSHFMIAECKEILLLSCTLARNLGSTFKQSRGHSKSRKATVGLNLSIILPKQLCVKCKSFLKVGYLAF